ncbi:MAG: alkaline phytoceramidase [Planctomycetes bacterium]|nr:alkaline phytoceramidase [Planctomycetota bacterium]
MLPGVAGTAWLLWHGPVPQDPEYHCFADQRTLWGIPHFGDVITNIPFVIAGVLGLWVVLARLRIGPEGAFREARERIPYAVLFAALSLTGFGSAYYHHTPTNATLFWDRLPLTLVFMSLFSIVIGEHVSPLVGRRLFLPLLTVGAASMLLWRCGEAAGEGQGDLRLYGMVQFYPMLAIPLILLTFRPLYTHGVYYWEVVGWYAAAKITELLDHEIFALNGAISGHNLKHGLAAAGCWWLVRMLQRRRPAGTPGTTPGS